MILPDGAWYDKNGNKIQTVKGRTSNANSKH